MTVVISEQHRSPSAAVAACFKFDVFRDAETTMTALLVERLIFAAVLETANKNALAAARSTTSETLAGGTVFMTIAQAERIGEAVTFQAGMLTHAAFSDQSLQRETAALLDQTKWGFEMVGAENLAAPYPATYNSLSPEKAAVTELASMCLSSSWQKEQMMLRVQALEMPAPIIREKVERFYRTYYKPENLCISVVGDVALFKTLVDIERLYGEFAPKPAVETNEAKPAPTQMGKAAPRSATDAAQSARSTAKDNKPAVGIQEQQKLAAETKPATTPGPRYFESRADISQSIVTIGFGVRDAGERELAAVEVLSALAGIGRWSRLTQSLLYNQRAVQRVHADFYKAGNGGFIAFQVAAEPASIDKAESALLKELDAIRRAPPQPAELARAKAVLERRFIEATSTFFGEARALALNGFRETAGFLKSIDEVKAEDVQAAAARYLNTAGLSVREIEPFTAPARTFDSEGYARTVAAWAPGLSEALNVKTEQPQPGKRQQADQASALRVDALESMLPLPVKDFSTYNGPRAFVREDHSRPLITLAILFQGGRILEDGATSGSTEMMLRSMLNGTARRTRAQIAAELDQLGADVQVVAEPDFFGFILNVVSRNTEAALRILHDVVENPAFKDDDLEWSRGEQMGHIRATRDSIGERSGALLLETIFSGHSYSLPAHGREEVVAKLSADQLRELHQRSVKRQYPLVIIVGDTEGSALVSGDVAEGFKRRDPEKTLTVKIPQQQKPSERIAASGLPLTITSIGFDGPKAESPDLPLVHLIASALVGQSGALHRQFRTKENAAIETGFRLHAGSTAGLLEIQMVTSADKEKTARETLTALMDQLSRGTVSADDLDAIRAAAAASLLIAQQSQRSLALDYVRAIFNRKAAAEVDGDAARIASATVDDLKRVATSARPSSQFVVIIRSAVRQ